MQATVGSPPGACAQLIYRRQVRGEKPHPLAKSPVIRMGSEQAQVVVRSLLRVIGVEAP